MTRIVMCPDHLSLRTIQRTPSVSAFASTTSPDARPRANQRDVVDAVLITSERLGPKPFAFYRRPAVLVGGEVEANLHVGDGVAHDANVRVRG
jgi:hypothetical protein